MYKLGLEIHCRVGNGKIFASGIRAIDFVMGVPGTMPILNHSTVSKCIAISKFLGCTISKTITFDRKVYFYHDSRVNYQISQIENRIGTNGIFEGFPISSVHIEQDVGKTKDDTVDWGRNMKGLVEITTNPIEYDYTKTITFLRSLQNNLILNNINNGLISMGELRCDLNFCNNGKYRAEYKNISGFDKINLCYEHYKNNYKNFIENGKGVTLTTVNDNFKVSRHKEEYGFTREPDIPPIETNKYKINQLAYFAVPDNCSCIVTNTQLTTKEKILVLSHYEKYKDTNIIELVAKFSDFKKATSIYFINKLGYVLKKHWNIIDGNYINKFLSLSNKTLAVKNDSTLKMNQKLDFNPSVAINFKEILRK